FLAEARASCIESLEELNEAFAVWVHHEHNTKFHREIDMTPLEYWSAYVVEADDPATVEIILAASFLIGGGFASVDVDSRRRVQTLAGQQHGIMFKTFAGNIEAPPVNPVLLVHPLDGFFVVAVTGIRNDAGGKEIGVNTTGHDRAYPPAGARLFQLPLTAEFYQAHNIYRSGE
ncbi:MAG: hypothetical protein R6V03_05770, partial [Kiritimatiellia bacterium]